MITPAAATVKPGALRSLSLEPGAKQQRPWPSKLEASVSLLLGKLSFGEDIQRTCCVSSGCERERQDVVFAE